MKITSSYAVELLHTNDILRPTVEVYREAVGFLIDAVDGEWEALKGLGALERCNWAERLVHSTKSGTARYDFDARFPRMPSYLRRAAIQAAIGAVSSFRSNLENYTRGGEIGQGPRLQVSPQLMPVFYKPQMYAEGEGTAARIKIFRDGKWVWHEVERNPTDVKYLEKYWSHCAASAPTLERKHRKYFLRFTFTEEVELPKLAESDTLVCAVKLGERHDAVCCTMRADGTVEKRRFIDLRAERDQLRRLCNRIGTLEQNAIYAHFRFARRVNEQAAIKIAREILAFAEENGANVIVYEMVEPGKQQYVKAFNRLSYLRKTKIQALTEHGGHRIGIRTSRVDGRNAETLPFDGREKDYDRELGASYNLGARYFIRETLKSLPARVRSHVEANVPGIERSASCTLATLRELRRALEGT